MEPFGDCAEHKPGLWLVGFFGIFLGALIFHPLNVIIAFSLEML